MSMSSNPGRGRGGFAPRRGRGGPQYKPTRPEVKPDINKHPLGELLSTIANVDLNPKSVRISDAASIENCTFVASYNWVDAKTPTIIVPGRPPLWTPLQHPKRLKEDSGDFFRDSNAARFPSFPTEPAVRAILHTDPDFPAEGIDVFGCGSTLGNLLRFTRGVDKPFRFHLETVGNTVFFVRRENDPRETIEGVKGYGHTFPEEYTTWESDVAGSESHQRLIQYNFGGLNCLVRFECDGYLPGTWNAPQSDSGPSAPTISPDELLGKFDSIKFTKNTSDEKETLKVQSAGVPPPQRAIFDLKTRSGRFKREIDMADVYPSLWLKQFDNFIIAYHDGAGTFKDIRVQDVRNDIRTWEETNKSAINRFAVLLGKIVEIARRDGAGLLEVYSPKVDRLEIRRQYGGGSHALPLRLRERWMSSRLGGVPVQASGDLRAHGHGMPPPLPSWQSSEYESDDEAPDYTACSVDDCGYCGRCTY